MSNKFNFNWREWQINAQFAYEDTMMFTLLMSKLTPLKTQFWILGTGNNSCIILIQTRKYLISFVHS